MGLEALGDSLEGMQYKVELWTGNYMNNLVEISPLSVAIIYGAGLLSALSPCGMSLLPFTVGYLSTEARAVAGPRAAPPRTFDKEAIEMSANYSYANETMDGFVPGEGGWGGGGWFG
jgi:hypothetical protein